MRFKVGDKVRFLNEEGTGVIIEVLSSYTVLVEDENGFDNQHKIKELVHCSSNQNYKLDGLEHVESVKEKMLAEKKALKDAGFDRKMRGLKKLENPEVREIDLHIEELIDSHRGMSNAQILSVQMANFKREMNISIRTKARKLIAIHGVGEGILKAEIRKELHYHYPEFSFHDADYRKYGYGATEIIFR